MSVNASTVINAPVGTVIETFLSEDFVRHVSEKANTALESLDVSGDTNSAFTVTTVRTMSPEKLPDAVRKFVKGAIKLTQVDSYDAPDSAGSRRVRTEIKAGGLPVSSQAEQNLSADGERTTIAVDGTVTANIPLVGKKIAAAAEPYIGKALTLQAREAEAWIAGRR